MIPFLTAFRRALPLLAAALFSCGREVDPADPLPSVVTVPQNVYLHGSTEHSLTFQWDPVDGAIGFNWKLTRDGAAVKQEQRFKRLRGNVPHLRLKKNGRRSGAGCSYSIETMLPSRRTCPSSGFSLPSFSPSPQTVSVPACVATVISSS